VPVAAVVQVVPVDLAEQPGQAERAVQPAQAVLTAAREGVVIDARPFVCAE
jgi:hypothetical protein